MISAFNYLSLYFNTVVLCVACWWSHSLPLTVLLPKTNEITGFDLQTEPFKVKDLEWK